MGCILDNIKGTFPSLLTEYKSLEPAAIVPRAEEKADKLAPKVIKIVKEFQVYFLDKSTIVDEDFVNAVIPSVVVPKPIT